MPELHLARINRNANEFDRWRIKQKRQWAMVKLTKTPLEPDKNDEKGIKIKNKNKHRSQDRLHTKM